LLDLIPDFGKTELLDLNQQLKIVRRLLLPFLPKSSRALLALLLRRSVESLEVILGLPNIAII